MRLIKIHFCCANVCHCCAWLVNIYDRSLAKMNYKNGKVAVFVGGTKSVSYNRFGCHTGVEIGADIVMKATKVDGVFAADPLKIQSTTL